MLQQARKNDVVLSHFGEQSTDLLNFEDLNFQMNFYEKLYYSFQVSDYEEAFLQNKQLKDLFLMLQKITQAYKKVPKQTSVYINLFKGPFRNHVLQIGSTLTFSSRKPWFKSWWGEKIPLLFLSYDLMIAIFLRINS